MTTVSGLDEEIVITPIRGTTRVISVLIVDDSLGIRDGLKGILAPHPDVEVVGEAGHGLEAIAVANELRPDVILMDAQMPRMDGMEATHFIKRHLPEVKVLFLAMIVDHRKAAVDAGADGFLLKSSGRAELLQAIRNLGHAA